MLRTTVLGAQFLSFIERFVVLRPYLGESTIRGFIVLSAYWLLSAYIHMYICTYIRTYVHTYIRTYIHTYCRLCVVKHAFL